MASGGLQPASVEQKADRAFVLAAVAETGGDLRYAAAKLKGDREVVMTAVKQSGGALWHASAKLKDAFLTRRMRNRFCRWMITLSG